ncbi:unnamed protein product [Didymodactylos carnosus]|uniref:NAD(P)(+)--arginine ADP-ribosyltransferase n=1 Tax=Didymodactylos carnosus TaxID=1234261 RepID=A0A814H4Q7_9BILA|nr:unnamed protein product [Didymodactylos carnosus]CAF1004901.1 unnamed protein product [Didymodactylos carnosus]CAF3677714.1 unnamed protein product [Didymodactylos carnosus]CAF3776252.1 unnamed protein product [Didymodactylos carnosus]
MATQTRSSKPTALFSRLLLKSRRDRSDLLCRATASIVVFDCDPDNETNLLSMSLKSILKMKLFSTFEVYISSPLLYYTVSLDLLSKQPTSTSALKYLSINVADSRFRLEQLFLLCRHFPNLRHLNLTVKLYLKLDCYKTCFHNFEILLNNMPKLYWLEIERQYVNNGINPQICRTQKNSSNCTPYEEANTNEIKQLFVQRPTPPQQSSTEVEHSRFVGEIDIEWHDVYPNAYRIAQDNHGFMKKWTTKIALKKLLEEIDRGYLDNMKTDLHERTGTDQDYKFLKLLIHKAIDEKTPRSLVNIYTAETSFYSILNRNLAKLGSDFRFEGIDSHLGTGYRDDIPPKNQGQYLFAAILINHEMFQPYYTTGKTYRGMNISESNLSKYAVGSSIMTRSFLSTSKVETAAENFLLGKRQNPSGSFVRLPVLCTYLTKNPRTALDIDVLSEYPGEKEVLIVPFTAFKVTQIDKNVDGLSRIDLEECEP